MMKEVREPEWLEGSFEGFDEDAGGMRVLAYVLCAFSGFLVGLAATWIF